MQEPTQSNKIQTNPSEDDLELSVGTPECRVLAVARCIKMSEHFHCLFKTWKDLGKALGINQVYLLTWEGDLQNKRATLSGVISHIIQYWIAMNGIQAKLVKLENALKEIGCEEIAEELRKTFRSSTI